MVDYADIVEFAVQVVEDTRQLGLVTDYRTILEQSERFITTKVIDIVDSSRIDPLQPVTGKDPLAKVIEILGLKGLHRIVVLNNDNLLDGIITQSAVMYVNQAICL
jgi:CBS-domain-containing membrane protein